jgi:hypothetical protein
MRASTERQRARTRDKEEQRIRGFEDSSTAGIIGGTCKARRQAARTQCQEIVGQAGARIQRLAGQWARQTTGVPGTLKTRTSSKFQMRNRRTGGPGGTGETTGSYGLKELKQRCAYFASIF